LTLEHLVQIFLLVLPLMNNEVTVLYVGHS